MSKMPNIFDGLRNLSDEEMLDQVVILETITMTNASKPLIQKASKNIVKAANFLKQTIGKEPDFKEPSVREIFQQIEDRRLELKYKKRDELETRFKKLLIEKLSLDNTDLSDDVISVKMVEEASQLYKISNELTPAQKIDAVYIRYQEKMLENIQKQLKKQNKNEADQTQKALDDALLGMTAEQRKQLTEGLEVNKLTGEILYKILLKAGAPAFILTTISMSGFGAYMALTTIIHAIFTTTLGITLPFAVYTGATSLLAFFAGPIGILMILGVVTLQLFNGNKKINRQLFAMVIWSSVNAYGDFFTPKEEELPSYVPVHLREIIKEEENSYFATLLKREEVESKKQTLLNDTTNLEKKLNTFKQISENEINKRKIAEERINELNRKQLEAKAEYTRLETEFQKLEKSYKTEKLTNEEIENKLTLEKEKIDEKGRELEFLNQQIRYQNDIIKDASKEISEKENQILNIQFELEKYKRKSQDQGIQIINLEKKLGKKEASRKKDIKQRWEGVFDKFIIESSVIREVVKLNRQELIAIERALIELHGCNDPKSLSRGKMHGKYESYEHMGFKFPDGLPARIMYEIVDIPVKKIRIIEIYKHNKKL